MYVYCVLHNKRWCKTKLQNKDIHNKAMLRKSISILKKFYSPLLNYCVLENQIQNVLIISILTIKVNL